MTAQPGIARDPFSYRADPAVPPFPDDRPIIVFDGTCRLCSAVVRFVLRHDRRRRFRFIAAQSALGTALYRHYRLDPVAYETNILLENGSPSFRSEGYLRLLEQLGLPWSLASCARLLPRSMRDRVYDGVGRNRLRWFGVQQSCFLPEAEQADRFLG